MQLPVLRKQHGTLNFYFSFASISIIDCRRKVQKELNVTMVSFNRSERTQRSDTVIIARG